MLFLELQDLGESFKIIRKALFRRDPHLEKVAMDSPINGTNITNPHIMNNASLTLASNSSLNPSSPAGNSSIIANATTISPLKMSTPESLNGGTTTTVSVLANIPTNATSIQPNMTTGLQIVM